MRLEGIERAATPADDPVAALRIVPFRLASSHIVERKPFTMPRCQKSASHARRFATRASRITRGRGGEKDDKGRSAEDLPTFAEEERPTSSRELTRRYESSLAVVHAPPPPSSSSTRPLKKKEEDERTRRRTRALLSRKIRVPRKAGRTSSDCYTPTTRIGRREFGKSRKTERRQLRWSSLRRLLRYSRDTFVEWTR